MAPRSLASKLLQAQLNQLSQNQNSIQNAQMFQQQPHNPQSFQQPSFTYTQPSVTFSQNTSNLVGQPPCHPQNAYYPYQASTSIISYPNCATGDQNNTQVSAIAQASPATVPVPSQEVGFSDIIDSLKDIQRLITNFKEATDSRNFQAKQLEALEGIADRLENLTNIQQNISRTLGELVI